jgi:TorA maturation chaperone TorD
MMNSIFGRYNLSSNTAKTIDIVDNEDQLRADMYSFLASLLRIEPNAQLVNQLTNLESDDSPIGKAIKTLSKLSSSLDLPTIRDEYVRIFVGVGRGEILPFASYYLTGFLKDKPLAKLRNDMKEIGIELADNVKEPEDHIASLFDMMAGLILGKFNKKFSIGEQRDFFNKHLGPWVDLLMRDIESSKIAVFYSPIGTIGREFMEIERSSFSMDVTG